MIFEIIQIIGPSILILIGFYLFIDKKTKEKIEEFQKEKELLEKLKKENEKIFTLEFEEDFLSDIEKHVKKNEKKYKPEKEKPHYWTEHIDTSKLYKKEKPHYWTEYIDTSKLKKQNKENNIDLFKISEEINKENKKKKKKYYELKKEYEKKGREFELKVKKYFEDLGYEVIDHAGINGKKDEGIDLIAINRFNDEYLCIQCKNWQKRKINHNHIKQFLSDYILYLKKHKNEVSLYKNRKFILAIPDKILTKAAYARIKENKDIIDYKIIN